MLTGQRFRLKLPLLGIETINSDEGKRLAVSVPAGDIVKIVSGPRPDDKRMVDVLWHRKKLIMFYTDIQAIGERVEEENT